MRSDVLPSVFLRSSFAITVGAVAIALLPVLTPVWIGLVMLALAAQFKAYERGFAPFSDPVSPKVQVTVSRERLRLQGSFDVPRSKMKRAYITSAGSGGANVVVETKTRAFIVRSRSPAEARAIMAGLGFAPEDTRFNVSAVSRLQLGAKEMAIAASTLLIIGGGLMLLNSSLVPWLGVGVVFTALLWTYVLSLLVAERVELGGDGLTLRRFGRTRFVPYGHITDVRPETSQLVLTTKSGVIRVQPLTTAFPTTSITPWFVGAVAHHISWAMHNARRTPVTERVRDELSRGQRSVEQWIKGVKGLPSAQNYRAAAVSRDELTAIATNQHESADCRIAAALALSDVDDHDTHKKIRISLEGAANPALRSAMEGALAGELELEAIEEATLQDPIAEALVVRD